MRVPTLWSTIVLMTATHPRHKGCQSRSHTESSHNRWFLKQCRINWNEKECMCTVKWRRDMMDFRVPVRNSLGITTQPAQTVPWARFEHNSSYTQSRHTTITQFVSIPQTESWRGNIIQNTQIFVRCSVVTAFQAISPILPIASSFLVIQPI